MKALISSIMQPVMVRLTWWQVLVSNHACHPKGYLPRKRYTNGQALAYDMINEDGEYLMFHCTFRCRAWHTARVRSNNV